LGVGGGVGVFGLGGGGGGWVCVVGGVGGVVFWGEKASGKKPNERKGETAELLESWEKDCPCASSRTYVH